MKKATDAQTKGAKDVGGDTEATKIKEPLLQSDDNIDNDGEELQEREYDERCNEIRNDEEIGCDEGSRTQILMYDKMEMMGKEEEEESVKVDESTLDDRLASVDVSDDVSALTQDEELSEEFKDKAATIFEAIC